MAQTKTDVSNSSYELLSFAVSRLSSAAILILLLDYCDVIASLSLGENKMAACRSKMSILLPEYLLQIRRQSKSLLFSDISWYEL